jgi:hypothetical protein
MPTASDLVTDLPADFETFGQAVATSMADLLGGTSGQVLSKASNTDMDFTWVTTDDTNAIQNAIVDAKGDLIAASAADTPARLAVGNNGETLVADSSTSTGLRYQAPKVQNAIYNSGFDIAQRGTSFTALAAVDYTLDRWVNWSSTGGQSNYASQQSVGNLSVSPNQAIRYCGRFGRTAATTNTGARYIFQTLETADSVKFAGQTVTMSFYARAGANYSPTSNALGAALVSGTGTDQIYYSFTGASTVANTTATLTTSWQRFSITGTVATNVTEIGTVFTFTPTGTAGAADYFEITGVQLEVGSVATPFNRMGGSIQQELAACQRYYYRNTTPDAYTVFGQGLAVSTTSATIPINLPVTMRVKPTSIDFSTLGLADGGGGVIAVTTGTISYGNSNVVTPAFGVAAGLTATRGVSLFSNNSTSAYVGFSAEL